VFFSRFVERVIGGVVWRRDRAIGDWRSTIVQIARGCLVTFLIVDVVVEKALSVRCAGIDVIDRHREGR